MYVDHWILGRFSNLFCNKMSKWQLTNYHVEELIEWKFIFDLIDSLRLQIKKEMATSSVKCCFVIFYYLIFIFTQWKMCVTWLNTNYAFPRLWLFKCHWHFIHSVIFLGVHVNRMSVCLYILQFLCVLCLIWNIIIMVVIRHWIWYYSIFVFEAQYGFSFNSTAFEVMWLYLLFPLIYIYCIITGSHI